MIDYYYIFPLASAIFFVLASLCWKKALEDEGAFTRIFFLSNLIMACCVSSLLFFNEEMPDWDYVHIPLSSGVFAFLGSVMAFLALRYGDVSVITPLMGSKAIFVAILVFLFLDEAVPGMWWMAAILAALAVWLLGQGHLPGRRQRSALTATISLLSALFFAFCDMFAQQGAANFGTIPYLVMNSFMIAAGSVVVVPLFRAPLTALSRKTLLWTTLASFFSSIQYLLLYGVISEFGRATAMNILYSSRGVWSVVLVWLLSSCFGYQEGKKAGPQAMRKRLLGAFLLLVAIILVLIEDLGTA